MGAFAKANNNDGQNNNLSPTESTKKFYNEHVDSYIANIQRAGVTHAPSTHLTEFVQYLQTSCPDDANKAALKVLELGCGYGRDAALLAGQHNKMHVIATDYSRAMLLKAQERLEQQQANNNSKGKSSSAVHFLVMDMRMVGRHFLPNSLHGIWACATIIHLPKKDIPPLLSSLYSILKPGGCVYVSVKVKQSQSAADESFDADERYGGIRKFYAFYDKEELLDYFLQQGFEIVNAGVSDHRDKDAYATHPFLHVFARKPALELFDEIIN